MKIKDARTMFAIRSSMLSTIQCNFKGNPEYAANGYLCGCGEEDRQAHLLTCPLYEHLRQDLDLENSDKDLVSFYQLVIKERQKPG